MRLKNVQVFIYSDKCKYRKENQDNFFANGNYNYDSSDSVKQEYQLSLPALLCVFDGLGGLDEGNTASKLACILADRYCPNMKNGRIDKEKINSFYINSNSALVRYQAENAVKLGTTAAMVEITKREIAFSNLGDSEIFLAGNGEIKKCSVPHHDTTLTNSSVEASEYANLSQYLGINTNEFVIEPHIDVISALDSGEYYIIICTDGISKCVSGEEMLEIIEKNKSDYAYLLAEKALENGSQDNVTALVAKINV